MYDVVNECCNPKENDIKEAIKQNKSYIVYKSPQCLLCYKEYENFSSYNDVSVIFIVRNCYYVQSSLNRRNNYTKNPYHSIEKLLKTYNAF